MRLTATLRDSFLFGSFLLAGSFLLCFFFQNIFLGDCEDVAHGVIQSFPRRLSRHFGRWFCFHVAILTCLAFADTGKVVGSAPLVCCYFPFFCRWPRNSHEGLVNHPQLCSFDGRISVSKYRGLVLWRQSCMALPRVCASASDFTKNVLGISERQLATCGRESRHCLTLSGGPRSRPYASR